MNLKRWYDTGDYFEHVGHRIFYRVEGEGRPLLLIHGYPTASWDWNKIWQLLAERFQCITMDMLGFGYSDKPRQAYSIFQQADFYCALLEKAQLIKISYGRIEVRDVDELVRRSDQLAGVEPIVPDYSD